MDWIKRMFFKKEEQKKEKVLDYERTYRDLLREDLNTVAVDVFHHDDPIIHMNPQARREYLVHFHAVVKEGKIIQRLEYLINKQANLTLKNSLNGELDTAGVMKMDGLSTFKDDVERLSNMFLKEESDNAPNTMTPREALKL